MFSNNNFMIRDNTPVNYGDGITLSFEGGATRPLVEANVNNFVTGEGLVTCSSEVRRLTDYVKKFMQEYGRDPSLANRHSSSDHPLDILHSKIWIDLPTAHHDPNKTIASLSLFCDLLLKSPSPSTKSVNFLKNAYSCYFIAKSILDEQVHLLPSLLKFYVPGLPISIKLLCDKLKINPEIFPKLRTNMERLESAVQFLESSERNFKTAFSFGISEEDIYKKWNATQQQTNSRASEKAIKTVHTESTVPQISSRTPASRRTTKGAPLEFTSLKPSSELTPTSGPTLKEQTLSQNGDFKKPAPRRPISPDHHESSGIRPSSASAPTQQSSVQDGGFKKPAPRIPKSEKKD